MRALRIVTLLAGLSACGGDPELDRGDASAPLDASAHVDARMVDREDATAGDAAVSGGWRSERALPEAIQEITGAVHGGHLWIAGGFDDARGIVTSVRVLDPATGEWRAGPELPAPRHHGSMVSAGPDLYLLGGMETIAFEPLDTAWVLRDGSSAWEPIASLPEDRGAAAAGFLQGRIVIAGGSGRGGLASTTLIYDPVEDGWTTGASIPTTREHTAAFTHEDELWVVAGRRGSLSSNRTEVEIYDPIDDAWRSGPPIPTARGGHGVAVLDGVAYAVGGEQPDRALDSVEALELATLTWRATDPLPTPRHGHVVLAAAGRVWAIGGGDAPIFAAVPIVESFAP